MGGSDWTGGLTYLRNLGHAVRTNIPEQLNLYLIHKRGATPVSSADVSAHFDGVVEVSPFGGSPCSPAELIRKGVSLLAGGDFINARRFERVLARQGIEAVFGNGLSGKYTLPSVGWFPDFQHVDLPQFFSRKVIVMRDLLVKRMARNCTLMVFSSQHARGRFVQLHPAQAEKARVLNFVAHLPVAVKTADPAYLLPKLRLPEKFIYLPNQLWPHKNHLTAFQAVKILADRNVRVCLVCSGNLCEQQNPKHKQWAFDYVQANGLADRIFILGMVDFDDVYALIRQSCCVLNPSLYEGWSTTVEETKTIGKPMILSDLEVHHEQNPPQTEYFEPKNAEMLATTMERAWRLYPAGPNRQMEEAAAQDYPRRSKRFAQSFADICRDAAAQASAHSHPRPHQTSQS
jgi:glycosyltransferase involved in cell wall biosynthesis